MAAAALIGAELEGEWITLRIGKRLVALVMALVLCCGCLAAPAAAVESRGIIDGAGYIISNAWNFWTGQGGQSGAAFFVNWLKAFLGDGKTPETATEEDWKNAYTQYNQNVQNNYNTTVIGSNGFYIPLYSVSSVKGTMVRVVESSLGSTSYVLAQVSNPTAWGLQVGFSFSEIICPVAGYYTLVPTGTFNGCRPKVSSSYVRVLCASGDTFSPGLTIESSLTSSGTYQARFTASAFVEPVGYGVNDFTQEIGGADSRVGTFSGNFGYYGDNGEMVFAENISIVNETNNTYYNPITGDTSTINEWTYDYSDRSYNVKLDTGDTVNVVYGDENIVIRQGDTVYNIYYTVPSTPEPTPPPSPTPLPTPTPSSSLPPTAPPGPTDPVEPGEKPDTSGWGILDFLKGIFDFLWGIVKAIGETIMNVLKALFLPKEESVTKVQDLMDEKLPFISDLQTFGDDFHGALVNPVARVRSAVRFTSVIDVGNKTSGVSYGDAQADILDVSWYLEYKDTVDDIIEGVAWLAFLWNLYGAVPSIIHGGASGVLATAQALKRKDEHDP